MDVAILDDYQAVAQQMADWSQLPSGINVQFFHDHIANEDQLVERLKNFQVVMGMRERTPFPQRGSNTGTTCSPDEVMQDPHLEDRAFWTDVEYPELVKTFRHTGPAAIFNGSPWRISRRAPLIGEHNEEVLCGELGLSEAELAVLEERGSV